AVLVDLILEIGHDATPSTIRFAGFVAKTQCAAFFANKIQIDVRVVRMFAGSARADFKVDRVALRPVDQMMTVGHAGLEAGGIARPQHSLTLVLDQDELAFKHVHELVLVLVPVTQRRSRTRLETCQVDAELRKAGDVAERSLLTPLADVLEF